MKLAAYILSLLLSGPYPEPKHTLVKDPGLRETVAQHAIEAGEAKGLDPYLLIYWAYQESRLKPDAVGKHPNPSGKVVKEKGICQVHGKARKTCDAAGLDVTTYAGGFRCLALLLDMGRRYCGSLEKGARWYMSGSCHKAKEKAERRLRAAWRTSCPFRGGTWHRWRKKCTTGQK